MWLLALCLVGLAGAQRGGGGPSGGAPGGPGLGLGSLGEERFPVVNTAYGRVRGVLRELNKEILGPVVQFLGVPYATPPRAPAASSRPRPPPRGPACATPPPCRPPARRTCTGRCPPSCYPCGSPTTWRRPPPTCRTRARTACTSASTCPPRTVRARAPGRAPGGHSPQTSMHTLRCRHAPGRELGLRRGREGQCVPAGSAWPPRVVRVPARQSQERIPQSAQKLFVRPESRWRGQQALGWAYPPPAHRGTHRGDTEGDQVVEAPIISCLDSHSGSAASPAPRPGLVPSHYPLELHLHLKDSKDSFSPGQNGQTSFCHMQGPSPVLSASSPGCSVP